MSAALTLEELLHTRIGGRFELLEPVALDARFRRFHALDADGSRCVVDLAPGDFEATSWRTEMTKLSAAQHPNLVTPIEVGIDETTGLAYVVEPASRGTSLAEDLTSKGWIEPELVARIAVQLADALVHAHEHGWVHSAITPGLIVTVPGPGADVVARLSGLGAAMMAQGDGASAASDVRDLAMSLYRALSGSTTDQPGGKIAPIASAAPCIPPKLASAIDHALDVDSERRYASAAAFCEALHDAAIEPGRERIGKVVDGRYTILRPIGEGGMGNVYEASGPGDQRVAVKIIRSSASDPDGARRFLREARSATRLTSQHVVRTIASGHDALLGGAFIVMELLHGCDLAKLLGVCAPLDPGVATRIVVDACAGVAAAHDVGMVHRDIKPSNLFLHEVGADIVVKVCDFGLAKQTLIAEASGALTQSGSLLGSPAYMSPEQATDPRSVDARCDVWSLAMTLYRALSAQSGWGPYQSIGELLVRLYGQDVVPLRDSAPWVEDGLAQVAHRALARDPAERYADAATFARALEPFASPKPLRLDMLVTVPAALRARRGRPSLPADSSSARATSTTSGPTRAAVARTSGVEGFRDDIARQLVLMGNSSPSYRRILELLDEILAHPAGAAIEEALARSWHKRSFEGPYERPLLLLASLRLDALEEGASHPLFDAIAAPAPRASSVSSSLLLAALAPERIGFWITLRSRRIQTNEVSRAVSWAWPATLAGCADRRRPLALVDVGASAGLNLVADLVPISWRRRTFGLITPPANLDVRARAGFDPRPLDVRRDDDVGWLRACVWPGQAERSARLEDAIHAFKRASPAPELTLTRASAVPGQLERFTKLVGAGGLVLVYQTLVRSYVPAAELEDYETAMQAWLRSGPKGGRVWATLELEDSSDPAFGCAIDVRVAAGGQVESVRLGLTSYHPDVIDADPAAERRLAALLS